MSALIARKSSLSPQDAEWLHLLVADWQVISDLAFADLVLWLPTTDDDLVAIARTRDFESLAELVTERLNSVEGIRDTETLNAMQVHSRHDIETMFSLGW